MESANEYHQPQKVMLEPGSQAVINGAIVTATGPCNFEVGSGAFVLTGRALWQEREALRHPHEELYFSMLEATSSPERFNDARYRLFNLLSQVVALSRTHAAQKECAACAAAMMSEDPQAAIASAARLASERLAYEAEMQEQEQGSAATLPDRRLDPFMTRNLRARP